MSLPCRADPPDVFKTDLDELIVRATERYCDECGGKIDRVEAPEGRTGAPDGKVMDGRGMWPAWHHHSPDCPLRISAEGLGLP